MPANAIELTSQDLTDLGYKPVAPASDFLSGDLVQLEGNVYLEIHNPAITRKLKVPADLLVLRLA